MRSTWPGKDTLATDVCVPISRLAECVMETKRDIEEHGLIAPIVGHVGDGNFHTSPVFDPATGEQTGSVGLASVAEVDAAVAAAKVGDSNGISTSGGRDAAP